MALFLLAASRLYRQAQTGCHRTHIPRCGVQVAAAAKAVANGARYGSGVRIAPEAKMDDGWLDVALVGEVGWMRLVEAIPIVLGSGDLRGFPEVQRHRGKRIVLSTDRPVKVHGDGELLGESPAEFEVLPGALRVMTPG